MGLAHPIQAHLTMKDGRTRDAVIFLVEGFGSLVMMTLLFIAAIVLICFTPFVWAFQRWFKEVEKDVASKGPREWNGL